MSAIGNIYNKLSDKVLKQISNALPDTIKYNYFMPKELKPKQKGESPKIREYIAKVQLSRVKQDVQTARQAIIEAELAYFAQRVKLIQLYQDTVLNGHVTAAMNRRKDLSLLKNYGLYDAKGVKNEQWTTFLQSKWFSDYQGYVLDSIFWGYSLIRIGDIVNSKIQDVTIIKRQNVSPDRLNIVTLVYNTSGIMFLEDPDLKKFTVWVTSNTENAESTCGHGLLYKIAIYELWVRHAFGNWAEYSEIFGMPIRLGKTDSKDESMRAKMSQMLENMGSSAWGVFDYEDQIELVEPIKSSGIVVYDDLRKACQAEISKIALGHASALDATPGRLGGDDPAEQALRDKQIADCTLLALTTNDQLIPKLRDLGFNIPQGLIFKFDNDEEIEEQRERDSEFNLKFSTMVKTLSDAGYEVDPLYITEMTKIPLTKKVLPTIPLIGKKQITNSLDPSMSEKLHKVYGV